MLTLKENKNLHNYQMEISSTGKKKPFIKMLLNECKLRNCMYKTELFNFVLFQTNSSGNRQISQKNFLYCYIIVFMSLPTGIICYFSKVAVAGNPKCVLECVTCCVL